MKTLTLLLSLSILGCSSSGEGPTSGAADDLVSSGTKYTVHDKASFDAAIARARPGDRIALADGSYPALTVPAHDYAGAPLRISGGRGAHVAGLAFVDTSNVVLQGLTITPPDTASAVALDFDGTTRDVLVDGVLVDGKYDVWHGGGRSIPAAVVNAHDGTTRITLQNSEITRCGGGVNCVNPRSSTTSAPGTYNLAIVSNTFHDCYSCDFVSGGGSAVLVDGNAFDRAVNAPGCTGGAESCPHNDHLQIMGGGPWMISRNRFGDRQLGAASVFLGPGVNNTSNPIHDVTVASNVFDGAVGSRAILIGDHGCDRQTPPDCDKLNQLVQKVTIVNNSVIGFDGQTSFEMAANWSHVAQVPTNFPVVANNLFRAVNPSTCALPVTYVSNLTLGRACPGVAHVDAFHLQPASPYAPTAQAADVIDQADPRYAPAKDFFGRARVGRPDRGAIEFQP